MCLEDKKLTHREYFKISVPFMLSTLTQPMLGAVDTAVVGKLTSPIFIGGVSIGVTIFNTLYWLFGFLRVSTISYSAQSIGSKNEYDKLKSFIQPLIMAFIIGIVLVLFQKPIWIGSMTILSPEVLVKEQAYIYYSLLIWGAPIVLSNYVILGWLMGQSKVKESVIMQVSGNLINIILDILLVSIFNLKVGGVAIATLFSQIVSLIVGISLMLRCSELRIKDMLNIKLFDKKEILNKVFINTDFVIRTVCLLIVNNLFMATSSYLGSTILAVNAIILQLESIISYLFEGLASASSVFIGKAIGNKNNELYNDTVKITFQWSFMLTILLTILYLFSRNNIIYLFTNIEEVILGIKTYDFWIIIYPSIACLGLTFYGVFSGAMYTKPIRNSTFLSMVLFIVVYKIFTPNFSNHGLWISFIIYYLGRTIFLLSYLKKLNSHVKSICIELDK